MTDKKISDLTALTTIDTAADYMVIVDYTDGTTKKFLPQYLGLPTFLSSPLTSTSWDGDSFSTTAKTKIDLSSVFSAPAGIKAALVRTAVRDSASAANDCWLCLGPTNTPAAGMIARCSGLANDAYASGSMIVPCDSNGDFYYQINASGSATFDVSLQIYGYWV